MLDPQVLLQLIERVDSVREELRKHQDASAEVRLELQVKMGTLREELARHHESADSIRRDISRLEEALISNRDWQTHMSLEMNRLTRSINHAKIEITNVGGDNRVDGDQALGGDVSGGKD